MPVIPLYQVDAFTSHPFRGNPAAVCLLSEALPDAAMQAIAAEMNLSETAFLLRTVDAPWQGGNTFALRWFTPKVEVALCGHATLSAAAVLFQCVGVDTEMLTFRTLSGDLRATHAGQRYHLDFPVDPPIACPAPPDVLTALSLPAVEAAAYGQNTGKLLLDLGDPRAVSALTPDFAALVAAESMTRFWGLIVTAAGVPPYHFSSRFFAPWVGINEDPVTGSAHTLLTPYWSTRLGLQSMAAYQASSRGGELWVSLKGKDRVDIAGEAVIVIEGSLQV